MSAATTTYIVIEVSEKENALDIMNILMTHTKARFTITKDIREYAAERDKLSETSRSSDNKNTSVEKAETPVSQTPPSQQKAHPTIRQESPDIEEIDAATYYAGLPSIVPKTENPDDHPPEPYGQQFPQYRQEALGVVPYPNMFTAAPTNFGLQSAYSHNQYQEVQQFPQQTPSKSNLPPWQASMEASWKEAVTPAAESGSRKRGRKPKEGGNGTSKVSSSFKCTECGVMVKAIGLDIAKRKNHAIVHLDLKRYKCPVGTCTYKSRHRSNISSHARSHHPNSSSKLHVPDILTDEQNEELRAMVEKCFPEMKKMCLPGDSEQYGDDVEEDEDE